MKQILRLAVVASVLLTASLATIKTRKERRNSARKTGVLLQNHQLVPLSDFIKRCKILRHFIRS